MIRNRRNYYRILHVQPEAPLEIIRASYRTLMGPLGQHPDKGGNHEAAALINEAYATLSDPVRRAAYDRTALLRGGRRASPGTAGPTGPASGTHGATRTAAAAGTRADPAQWQAQRCCPFCQAAMPRVPPAPARCRQCSAPLTPMPRPDPRRRELMGARSSTRTAKRHTASLFTAPGAPAWTVRMRDLSLTGASMLSAAPLPPRHPVRIVDGDIEAVGVVVACRRRDAGSILHVQWLTICVGRRTGVFVSETA